MAVCSTNCQLCFLSTKADLILIPVPMPPIPTPTPPPPAQPAFQYHQKVLLTNRNILSPWHNTWVWISRRRSGWIEILNISLTAWRGNIGRCHVIIGWARSCTIAIIWIQCHLLHSLCDKLVLAVSTTKLGCSCILWHIAWRKKKHLISYEDSTGKKFKHFLIKPKVA